MTRLQAYVTSEKIAADDYRVKIVCRNGDDISITEDDTGIILIQNGYAEYVSRQPINLTSFENHPYRSLLRILHHEILINIVGGQPLPNFLVYEKPWYRDAAMMAMVLYITGNIHLIEEWILNITNPFDRNNAGHEEPDNLGQLLYLISLTNNPSKHPLIPRILSEAEKVMHNDYLIGITDGQQHAVYQSKWYNYGLYRLDFDDALIVPDIGDSYAGLCWWDKEDINLPEGGHLANNKHYPYLSWAEAHFMQAPPPLHLAGQTFPLTWETKANQANHEGMRRIHIPYVTERTCKPHTWHAAEMFLYLYELES
jgi:hypothetical protein